MRVARPEGGTCAADFCAGLGGLAWLSRLGMTTHAELVNATTSAPASSETKRRARGTRMEWLAPVDVTSVLPSSCSLAF